MGKVSQAGWIYHVRRRPTGSVYVWYHGDGHPARSLPHGDTDRPRLIRYAYGPRISVQGMALARDLLCHALGRFAVPTALVTAFYREFLSALQPAREHVLAQDEILTWYVLWRPTAQAAEKTSGTS